MKNKNFDKLLSLIKRYQAILWLGAFIFICSLVASLWIYYHYEGHPKESYWFQVADFFMNISQTILGTVVIGGGLGSIVNFIFEEQKKEEEAVMERLRRMQESRDKRRQFRKEMRDKLQSVYDNVALARALIQSHRSAKTYGDQIRDQIMPGEIALQDFKRELVELGDQAPIKYPAELLISLTYMAAYLSALIKEFGQHYVDIANLQNYQDVLANRRRNVFADVLETQEQSKHEDYDKQTFLEQADQLFQSQSVPNRMEAVWEAMERLDYIWDFIADLRDEKGKTSLYQTYFVDHHFHCLRILQDKDASINEKLCRKKDFKHYLKVQEGLVEKKHSEQPITKHDSLTRTIMIKGLGFDFEVMGRSQT